MANKIPQALTTFLKACREFPRWMSIRKRIPNSAEKTISGAWLESVLKEQDDISKELDQFISEFFLLSYVGRESEIPDYVYVYHIGDVAFNEINLTKPDVAVTIDGREYLNNIKSLALLQEGYITISPELLPSDGKIEYVYNGYSYGGDFDRYHIWNIIDEFAMFLSLSRFLDVQETNEQLMRRCFRVFTDPANSTIAGLKNAIKNAMINDYELQDSEILIERPDSENVWINDGEYDSLYERLAQFNRDVFRTKRWDRGNWENNFKTLAWLPHPWDKELNVFQDGTGQRDDCKVTLLTDSDDETDVTVRGYVYDQVAINEWFHKENYRRKISLHLMKYTDILQPQFIQYKITATPAQKIDPTTIYFNEQTIQDGSQTYYIQDLVTAKGANTIVNPGALTPNKEYYLVFKPRSTYANMDIRQCDIVNANGTKNSLLTEKSPFKFKTVGGNRVLYNDDIKKHVTNIHQCTTANNIIDYTEGLILGNESEEGTLTIDVTGLDEQPIKVEHISDMVDITHNVPLWDLNGLYIDDTTHTLYSPTTNAGETATLELDCMGFTYTLDANENPELQGSVAIKAEINYKNDTTLSKVLSTPNEIIERRFDQLTHVKLTFTKNGSYPFVMKNIKATRYDITLSLTEGEILQTNFGSYLPKTTGVSQYQVLTVHVKNYDVVKPVIKSIHVGAASTRARYEIRNLILTEGQYLEIDTDCQVELYDSSQMFDRLVDEDYITKWKYRNDTIEDQYLEIDTKNFLVISESSKKISKTVRAGNTVSYITVSPNEVVNQLTITGILHIDRARRTIKDMLGLENYYEVYVSKDAPGFIIYNPRNNTEWFSTLQREIFVPEANKFTFEGLPDGTIGCFKIDRTKEVVGIEYATDRYFDDAYVKVQNSPDYVAYNTSYLFTSPLDDVEIVNTFHPIMDMNAMMYYTVDKVSGGTADSKVVFRKPNRQVAGTYTYEDNWSLGVNSLCIFSDIEYDNTESYDIITSSSEKLYSIANVIELEDYKIDGVSVDLGEYIITPPAYMEVLYEDAEYIEGNDTEIFVEEDGFNKLKYSNISEVQYVMVDKNEFTDYTIIKDAGIIVWNDIRQIRGHQYYIAYKYKKPIALRYTSLEYMYDMISYKIDAYLPTDKEPVVLTHMTDGEQRDVTFSKIPDKVVLECSNDVNFAATYANGIVTVKRLFQENVVLVNTGYYYDDGLEYYLYNHDHKDFMDRMQNIEFHNVLKYELLYRFMMATNNFLPSTDFRPSEETYERLCYVNFMDPEIESAGISKLDIITACDSYNAWYGFNMNISLKEGLNGVGLSFTPDRDTHYALLNISQQVRPGSMISFYATADIKAKIMREIKADDEAMLKGTFTNPFADLVTTGNFRYYLFPEDLDMSYRYYLMIQGDGTVDDIIIRDNLTVNVNQEELHTKNIDRLGLDITEKSFQNQFVNFLFDRDGNVLTDLEITRNNWIQNGANIDWNITKVFQMSEDNFSDFKVTGGVVKIKNAFYAEDIQGTITTPLIYIPYHNSTVDLYFKVNNVVIESFQNFSIRIFSTPREDIPVREVAFEQRTNMVNIYGSQSNTYIQGVITVPARRVVDSIEVYIKYGETEAAPLMIEEFNGGNIVTKVYDAAAAVNMRPYKIDGTTTSPKTTKLYVRAARESSNYMVWTDWYLTPMDDDMVCINNPHVFQNYRFYQFKVETLDKDTQLRINNFVMEVV